MVDLKTCRKCGQGKPPTLFSQLPGGHTRGTCKGCRETAARERWRVVNGGTTRGYRLGLAKVGQPMTCSHCRKLQPADHYQLYKGRPSGWCRRCSTVRECQRQAQPIVRQAVRIKQWERRHRQTSEEARTVDHLTPPIRGGAHTVSNIVMACRRCNSRKGRKTEVEFRAWCEARRPV